MLRLLFACIISLNIFLPLTAVAQPGIKQIEIIRADRLNIQKQNDQEFNSLAGNVIVVQGKTTFYCDSAVLNKTLNTLEAFGRVHINDADSIHTYSDYLRYEGNNKKAFLNNNVKLTDGKATLTTSQLDYDLNSKIGVYYNGGKLVNGNTVLNSRQGVYYGETNDVLFKHQVDLADPEFKLKTDSLLYNTNSKIASFITTTRITSKDREIVTTDGFYDLTTKRSSFGKRPTIKDGSTVLIADAVVNDDATGFGEANGNVVWIDTAQSFTLYAGNLKSNKNNNAIIATVQPLMAVKQDTDSLFIAADTFYSASLSHLRQFRTVPTVRDSVTKLSADSTADRFFEAYHNVRIFSDSLQGVSDSLFYSAEDSVFRLFTNPVVWNNNNQITGDTIYVFTLNRKPEQLKVFENAMVVSRVINDRPYFNQVKGRIINGFFIDGAIDRVYAKGNAENIYYAQDEKNKLMAVNESSSDAIEIFFKNQEPEKVALRTGVKGTNDPIRRINPEEKKLRGFQWLQSRRPTSKFELLKK